MKTGQSVECCKYGSRTNAIPHDYKLKQTKMSSSEKIIMYWDIFTWEMTANQFSYGSEKEKN